MTLHLQYSSARCTIRNCATLSDALLYDVLNDALLFYILKMRSYSLCVQARAATEHSTSEEIIVELIALEINSLCA